MIGGRHVPEEKFTERKDAISSAISCTAIDIAFTAMTDNGERALLPTEEITARHIIGCAFAFYVALSIWVQVQAEDDSVEPLVCFAGVMDAFTVMRSEAEREKITKLSFEIYERFRDNPSKTARMWSQQVSDMSLVHVKYYGREHELPTSVSVRDVFKSLMAISFESIKATLPESHA